MGGASVQTPLRDVPRREGPLAALDQNHQPAPPTPGAAALKPQTPVAQQAHAPQKKRKKVKPSSMCQTPPAMITGNGIVYERGGCIGEGGFARCFEVHDGSANKRYAAKTLAKAALTSQKTRSKLITEIKIHKAMSHPNIVQFVDCFEDPTNVYMLLEMCENQSLSDMVHRREHLSETEARFFFVQLLGAVGYMHARGVLHRDLKLGNIFLDQDMNLKVGDFGLAARVSSSRRRYTVCGTPNYISPEVLRRPHAHGLPTDIWAAGIVLYAMLVGRPPFQERDVEDIYERIKRHERVFPQPRGAELQSNARRVSPEAKELIMRMLHPLPEMRPSIQECLDHPWVKDGTMVRSLPSSALHSPVKLSALPLESKANLAAVSKAAGLHELGRHHRLVEDVSANEIQQTTASHILPESISPPSTRDKYKQLQFEPVAQDEPACDSPVVGRNGREVPAIAEDSPADRKQPDYRPRFRYTAAPLAARTSTGVADGAGPGTASRAPSATSVVSGASTVSASSAFGAPRPAMSGSGSSRPLMRPASTSTRNVLGPMRMSLRATANTLASLLETQDLGVRSVSTRQPVEPPVFVTRWADFEENWGVAYCLSDGAVGTLFRDNTSMRMDPVFGTYMYYEKKSNPGSLTLHRTAADTAEPRRAKKVEVLNYVRKYMDRELGHAVEPQRKGGDVSMGEVVYAVRKSQGYIMFVLTDGSMQFNFKDHNKVVVYENGSKIGLVTDHHQTFSWTTADALVSTQAAHFQRVRLPQKLATIQAAARDYLAVIR